MVTGLLDEHLSEDVAGQVERDVVHATDPAGALVMLSASASMLVVASSSDHQCGTPRLGGTTRRLLGSTRCPVMVVPRGAPPETRFW